MKIKVLESEMKIEETISELTSFLSENQEEEFFTLPFHGKILIVSKDIYTAMNCWCNQCIQKIQKPLALYEITLDHSHSSHCPDCGSEQCSRTESHLNSCSVNDFFVERKSHG